MQDLTEAVTALKCVSPFVTLPASLAERYDELAERLFQPLQRVVGRVEKLYPPFRSTTSSASSAAGCSCVNRIPWVRVPHQRCRIYAGTVRRRCSLPVAS